MPVNPMLESGIRRHAPLLGAAVVLLVLVALHLLLFQPTQRRYAKALQAAGGVDAVLDPDQGPPPLPPRVFALIADNAMTADEVTRRTASGQFATMMLEDLSALASRSGLTVTLSEPGALTPLPSRVEARVTLRVRGAYRELVAFLQGMENLGRLYDLERYQITDLGPELQMEMSVVRVVLKQSRAGR